MSAAPPSFESVSAARKAPPRPGSSAFAALNQSLGIRATATVWQCKPKKCSTPGRLTLRSSGQAPAGRLWASFHSGPNPSRRRLPLNLYVRRLRAARRKNPNASRCERVLKEALAKSKSIGAATKRSLSSASSLLGALHESSAPAQARSKANVSQSVGSPLRISSTSAPRETSVVGQLSSGSERTSGFSIRLAQVQPIALTQSFRCLASGPQLQSGNASQRSVPHRDA